VITISSAVVEELLDTSVNCGIGFTKPLLQRALNLLNNQSKAGWPDLSVDGVYGPATLNALKTYLAKRGKDREKVLVRVINIMQGQRYIEICERNPSQEQFFMAGLLTAFHYEGSKLTMCSAFRMHSKFIYV